MGIRDWMFGVLLKIIEGEDGMTEFEAFVLKDSRGNYVGVNSIAYDKPTKKYMYSWSEQFTNGYYTYTDENDVNKALNIIKEMGTKIKFGIAFHFKKINMLEVLQKEFELGNIQSCPFKHMIIEAVEIDPPIVDSIGVTSVLMDYRAMCEVGI